MKRTNRHGLVLVFPARLRISSLRHSVIIFTAAFLCGALVSCSSVPSYPAFPPPLTKTLGVGSGQAFQIVRSVLNEDTRLVVDTVDNAGRFVALEKTSGFIFFQQRTIIDIRLEPVSAGGTRILMSLKAEAYESGGLTHPAGWYPVAGVNTALGEDIMRLIEEKVVKTAG